MVSTEVQITTFVRKQRGLVSNMPDRPADIGVAKGALAPKYNSWLRLFACTAVLQGHQRILRLFSFVKIITTAYQA